MIYKESMFNNYNIYENKIEVYNSFTKARIYVKEKQYISNLISRDDSDFTVEEKENIGILYKNGFIVQKLLNEKAMLKYVFNKKFFNQKELGLILLPTLSCNFNCQYCFEKVDNKLVKVENENYYKIILKYIDNEIKNYKKIHFNFFGGEPLLTKYKIKDFIQDAKQLLEDRKIDYDSSIVTNGSLLDEEIIKSLVQFRCKLIQITLDGNKSEHDRSRIFKDGSPSFDLLIQKIKLLISFLRKVNADITVLLRINLENSNLGDVQEILTEFNLDERKAISLLFRPVFNTKKYHEKNIVTYDMLDEFNKLGIEMGFKIFHNKRTFLSCEGCSDNNLIHILPDLSVWKCVNDLSSDEARIGQIDDKGKTIWDIVKIINWYNAADYLEDEKCENCSIAPDCSGGCVRKRIIYDKRFCGSVEALSSAYRYGD